MASRLADGALTRGVHIAHPVMANEVFALVAEDRVADLASRFHFYVWQAKAEPGFSLVRWVTSWDTQAEEVDALLAEF
jgi:threonine aldolase